MLCGLFHRIGWHPIWSIVVSHLITVFLWSTPVYKYIQHRREVTEENIRKNTPAKQCCWKRPVKKEEKEEKKEEKKVEIEMNSGETAGVDSKKPEEKKKTWNPFSKNAKEPKEQPKEQKELPKEEVKKEPPQTNSKAEEPKKTSWNLFTKKKDTQEEAKNANLK